MSDCASHAMSWIAGLHLAFFSQLQQLVATNNDGFFGGEDREVDTISQTAVPGPRAARDLRSHHRQTAAVSTMDSNLNGFARYIACSRFISPAFYVLRVGIIAVRNHAPRS